MYKNMHLCDAVGQICMYGAYLDMVILQRCTDVERRRTNLYAMYPGSGDVCHARLKCSVAVRERPFVILQTKCAFC